MYYTHLFFFLIAQSFLYSNEAVPYQTNFPTLVNYLSQYEITPSEFSNEIFLCTYPRTGTNITVAILSYLTNKNCLWAHTANWEKGTVINRACLKIDENQLPILVSHHPEHFKRLKKENLLIVTLRDYKEIFCRTGKLKYNKQQLQHYLNVLKLYDTWPDSKKLIYYEKTIQDPLATIAKLAHSLNSSQKKKDLLLKNYDSFSNTVLTSYHNHMKTKSFGKEIDFHQRNISKSGLLRLQHKLKVLEPNLFKKYLISYELKG